MGRAIRCLYLAAVVCVSAAPASPQASVSDPEVARGIALVEEGDHDAAIVTLDAATRRLAAASGASRHDLSQGLLYLGVAYLAKGHELSAKARFREALAQEPDLKLNTDQFPPKVIEKFEEARAEIRAETRVEKPGPAPSAAASPRASPPPKKGGSKTPLILIGAGVAVAGGVAVAAGGGGSSATPPTTTALSYRLEAADTQMFPAHGGTGGQAFAIACPSGSLANGYTGQTDVGAVSRIGLGCAALQPDGTTGAETTVSAGTGPGGQFTNRCPTGQAAVGLSGSFGSSPSGILVVTQVMLGCAPLSDWAGGGGAVTRLEGHGSSLGTSFSDTCSTGYVIVGLSGASGGLIDRVAITCMRVRR